MLFEERDVQQKKTGEEWFVFINNDQISIRWKTTASIIQVIQTIHIDR